MRSPEHFIINLAVGLVLLNLVPGFTLFDLWLMLLASVIFDIDHILYYLAKERNLNFRKFNDFRRELYGSMQTKIFTFHTFDFLVVFGLVVWQFPSMFYFYLGYLIHVAADWARAAYHFRRNRKGFIKWTKYWILLWNIKHRNDSTSDAGMTG